jgi:hypothetical protein
MCAASKTSSISQSVIAQRPLYTVMRAAQKEGWPRRMQMARVARSRSSATPAGSWTARTLLEDINPLTDPSVGVRDSPPLGGLGRLWIGFHSVYKRTQIGQGPTATGFFFRDKGQPVGGQAGKLSNSCGALVRGDCTDPFANQLRSGVCPFLPSLRAFPVSPEGRPVRPCPWLARLCCSPVRRLPRSAGLKFI